MPFSQTGIKPLSGSGGAGSYSSGGRSSDQNFLPPQPRAQAQSQSNYAQLETTTPAPPPGNMNPIDYWNQIPEAGYWQYLTQRGLLGQSNQDKYSQGRQGYYYNRYLAEAAENPNLGFYDYLMQNQFDPVSDYFAQSPGQRGDFSSRFMTPRGRWVNVG